MFIKPTKTKHEMKERKKLAWHFGVFQCNDIELWN